MVNQALSNLKMSEIFSVNRCTSNAEYRLLGKGLKYCPKPKSHDQIQLKQNVF